MILREMEGVTAAAILLVTEARLLMGGALVRMRRMAPVTVVRMDEGLVLRLTRRKQAG
jgi:hypothetical protein